jgi:hemin uptake protein HemP
MGEYRTMRHDFDPERDDEKPPPGECQDSPRVVSTQELFQGKHEICIDHEGERYRLRITRRNKLILQK